MQYVHAARSLVANVVGTLLHEQDPEAADPIV